MRQRDAKTIRGVKISSKQCGRGKKTALQRARGTSADPGEPVSLSPACCNQTSAKQRFALSIVRKRTCPGEAGGEWQIRMPNHEIRIAVFSAWLLWGIWLRSLLRTNQRGGGIVPLLWAEVRSRIQSQSSRSAGSTILRFFCPGIRHLCASECPSANANPAPKL